MIETLLSAEALAALLTLIAMEIVLGIDNLIFIAILVGKLPKEHQDIARKLGISMALVMRLFFLGGISWLTHLTAPLFNLGLQGAIGPNGVPSFETAFSWRDIILIVGGLFLIAKTVKEIHERIQGVESEKNFRVTTTLAGSVVQIMLIDIVFSVDSILTAVGMTNMLSIMMIAVIVSMIVMLFASKPVLTFINAYPTVVMLALSFLLMIGMVLIADGFGMHVPRGYIYMAILFSCMVEFFNALASKK